VYQTYRCYADKRAEPWANAKIRLGASVGLVQTDVGDAINRPAYILWSVWSLALPKRAILVRSFAAIPSRPPGLILGHECAHLFQFSWPSLLAG
jgi:hypothetical protein